MNEGMIQIGDKVCARYFEIESDIKGIVTHVPQDIGDMFYIKTEYNEIKAINPLCSILVGIFQEK